MDPRVAWGICFPSFDKSALVTTILIALSSIGWMMVQTIHFFTKILR